VVAAGAEVGMLKLGMLGMLEHAPRAKHSAPKEEMATTRFMIVSVPPAATGRAHRDLKPQNPVPGADPQRKQRIAGQCALITVNVLLSVFTLRESFRRTVWPNYARHLSVSLLAFGQLEHRLRQRAEVADDAVGPKLADRYLSIAEVHRHHGHARGLRGVDVGC
jgi:hypothetical protein